MNKIIKMSKKEWLEIGKTAGYIKQAKSPEMWASIERGEICPLCENKIEEDDIRNNMVEKLDGYVYHTLCAAAEKRDREMQMEQAAKYASKKQAQEESIAGTILQQLGGNKFAIMTGANNFTDLGNGLSFRLPGSGGFTKDGINFVKIILDPSDTYTVEFGRIIGNQYKTIYTTSDIYFDSLQDVFTRITGLDTHL